MQSVVNGAAWARPTGQRKKNEREMEKKDKRRAPEGGPRNK